jgi:hypothetical protein
LVRGFDAGDLLLEDEGRGVGFVGANERKYSSQVCKRNKKALIIKCLKIHLTFHTTNATREKNKLYEFIIFKMGIDDLKSGDHFPTDSVLKQYLFVLFIMNNTLILWLYPSINNTLFLWLCLLINNTLPTSNKCSYHYLTSALMACISKKVWLSNLIGFLTTY